MISDPDGSLSTGDEAATDGALSATKDDQTCTARGAGNKTEFGE